MVRRNNYLSEQKRQAIILRGKGLLYREIADIMQLDTNNVVYHVRSGIKFLGVKSVFDALVLLGCDKEYRHPNVKHFCDRWKLTLMYFNQGKSKEWIMVNMKIKKSTLTVYLSRARHL